MEGPPQGTPSCTSIDEDLCWHRVPSLPHWRGLPHQSWWAGTWAYLVLSDVVSGRLGSRVLASPPNTLQWEKNLLEVGMELTQELLLRSIPG